LIADRFVVPPGEDHCYVEKVVRLPDGFLCFDPPTDASVSPLPAGSRAPLTFASFHHPAKINREVVQLWVRVLKSQPGARIWFIYTAYDMPEVQERIRGWFAEGGIGGDAIIFEGRLPRHEYLERYHYVDLALDPFPFSGGTITCEALWMGVPVVTLPGQTFAGRHSLSHPSVAGLTETIARDAHDYVAIVKRFGSERDRLRALRSSLRDKVAFSPLCDGPRFARHFQAALRQLWDSGQQERR
jgi:predicted O-linked N-acetylglucosamine transferase (SPINDLY family)